MALAGLGDPVTLNREVLAVDGAKRLSTFYGYYVLQARAKAGDYQGCLDAIRAYWGGMLDMGATTFWEDFDLDWMENASRIDELPVPGKKDIHGDYGAYCYLGFRHSLCHGWASGPTPWLTEHVLGIQIVEPGCRVLRVSPHLGDLAWAEGTFPTPRGIVRVRHEKQPDGSIKSTIEAPPGVKISRTARAPKRQAGGGASHAPTKRQERGIPSSSGRVTGCERPRSSSFTPSFTPGSAGRLQALQPLERTERFDGDPHWEARNNRPDPANTRTVRQDFGYSPVRHAGGAGGEAGGFITPAAEPAYYARKIPARTLQDPLSASGTIACPGRKLHVLLGFFNSGTINEWRTPNSLAIRLQGRGDIFYAYVEYATQKWRAGGDSPGGFETVRDDETGKMRFKGFPGGAAIYRWSLRYDPEGNNGTGSIRVTLGDQTSVCNLAPGHKADGATFNRFGLLNVVKSVDNGGEVWLENVTIEGRHEDFGKDPGWEAFQNRRTYKTTNARPHGDFGYSPTSYAGGKPGELGGLIFRGDCRKPGAMACYGDRLDALTLDKPLKASGKIAMLRGVSDSTTLIGFYNSRDSMAVTDSQQFALPRSFLGVAIEGPSGEGFFVYPAYRLAENTQGAGKRKGEDEDRPHILPDGAKHLWNLDYAPNGGSGTGRITVTLDGHATHLDLPAGGKGSDTRFDRFGIITTWIDGNGQRVYFDNLTYSVRQP